MRYTPEELEKMRHRAAIDKAGADKIVEDVGKEADSPFNEYITVREVCELTGSSRGQLYYSLNNAPMHLPGVKHGLWFIHVDDAIGYADILKERRLRRAGQLAAAAGKLEKRNQRRLAKAKKERERIAVIEARTNRAKGDATTKLERARPIREGWVTITQASEILGINLPTASQKLSEAHVPKERVGQFVMVPLESVRRLKYGENGQRKEAMGQ